MTNDSRCLTCGGPARLCAASDRCVAIDDSRVRPPVLAPYESSRTVATITSFGWRARAALTAAIWLFGLLMATRVASSGRPLAVFVGVPYVAVALVLTREFWRPHRVTRHF